MITRIIFQVTIRGNRIKNITYKISNVKSGENINQWGIRNSCYSCSLITMEH